MNIFIVYAHPGKESFTRKILQQLKTGLIDAGHKIKISDLYQMNFNPTMTPLEYEREGYNKIEFAVNEDVKQEQNKIEDADCIIFVYPVWWSDCPAIMKGWFDRVYTVGYAYGYDTDPLKSMKKIKYGLVVCTAGHPNKFLDEIGISESMKKIMIDDRLGKRFENKKMLILGGTLNMEKVEETHLKNAYDIGRNLEAQFDY